MRLFNKIIKLRLKILYCNVPEQANSFVMRFRSLITVDVSQDTRNNAVPSVEHVELIPDVAKLSANVMAVEHVANSLQLTTYNRRPRDDCALIFGPDAVGRIADSRE